MAIALTGFLFEITTAGRAQIVLINHPQAAKFKNMLHSVHLSLAGRYGQIYKSEVCLLKGETGAYSPVIFFLDHALVFVVLN